MQIKKTKVSAETERIITTGYIISDQFLNQILPIHDDRFFLVPYSRTVAGWCKSHYQKYQQAPKADIQKIFIQHKNEKKIDEEVLDLIEEFLSGLSDDFEQNGFNEAYITDTTEKYFAKRKLELLNENLSAYIHADQLDKAEQVIAGHVRLKRPQAGSIDVIRDHQEIINSLTEERDIVLELPGALGELVGPIERGDFLSIIGPMKRGKTFWLEDFAVRLMFRQQKVLFVSMEMPRNQMMRRIYQNFLGETKTEKTIELPYFDEDDEVSHKTVNKKGMTTKAALKKAKSIQTLIKSGAFRLICYPAYSANVSQIRTEIDNLSYYEGFYPDAVVIDYADILAPEPAAPREYRHRINDTWMELRRLAQEIHGLVITASQSDRSTFSKDVSEENTAEDIRKLAHVTHMLALNQTKEEKQEGIMRLSMLANRNEEFNTNDELHVLYNYSIAKAYLDGRWKKKVKSDKKS